MRDLRDVLARYEAIAAAGGVAALATLIHAEGSTYRRPGARLLIAPDDVAVGLVSGGCLEADIIERAQSVLAGGPPLRLRYDHSRPDDVVWGHGLGCAGVVEVFVERVNARSAGPLQILSHWLAERRSGAIATRVSGARAGARRVLGVGTAPRGDAALTTHDPALSEALASGHPALLRDPDGDVAVEVFRPPPELALFGVGPDALPLVAQAELLGWDVRLWDERPHYARPDRLPGRSIVCCPADTAADELGIGPGSFCVVMTHHYLRDRRVLPGLLATGCPYVAVLGPRRRTEQLLSDLRLDGALPDDALERVFGPAGLDLGADSPEEIALSIAAEIRAVAAGRQGGPLRERKAPIHAS
jgi:xanthine dehydrogenase accessory factor